MEPIFAKTAQLPSEPAQGAVPVMHAEPLEEKPVLEQFANSAAPSEDEKHGKLMEEIGQLCQKLISDNNAKLNEYTQAWTDGMVTKNELVRMEMRKRKARNWRMFCFLGIWVVAVAIMGFAFGWEISHSGSLLAALMLGIESGFIFGFIAFLVGCTINVTFSERIGEEIVRKDVLEID